MEASEPREIEVMMLYTARAKANDAAVEARLRLSIEEANTAMANSDTGVRFRIVHLAEVVYEASGDLELDLERLRSGFDGIMDEVHGWRDRYKADLVCLIVDRSETFSALGHFAYGPEHGFSVIYLSALAGYNVLAHELGHNLGCDHDEGNAMGGGAFPFSHGHRFEVDGAMYRTVMSYLPGMRIPHYSNPDISFLGVPTGVSDAADNARTIRAMAPFIDTYRGLTVEIAHPSNDASFAANQTIELAAMVTSDEGPILSVEFMSGDTVLDETAVPPHRFLWMNPAPGRHALSARTRIPGGYLQRSREVVIGVRPLNDDFANRLRLSGSNAVSSAILYAASAEADEPLSLRGAGGTVWWSWIAPHSGMARVSASGAVSGQAALSVFSGAVLPGLRPIQTSRVSNRDMLFQAASGEEYQICLAGGPASGPVSLYLTMQAPPPNDDVANAERIDLAAGTITGSTVAATAEPDEVPTGLYPLGHSVWFAWSPPYSGKATLALIPGRAEADFGVYSGTNLAGLTLVANSAAARQGFLVDHGRSYFIAVDGAFQTFSLALNVVKPAANDSFSKPATAPSTGGSLSITPALASREPNEPAHGTTRGGHSQWWSWRAPSHGGVRIVRDNRTSGMLPNLNVAWYTGNALTNLIRLASCDFTNNVQEGLVLPVRGGTNYIIAIESGAGLSQSVRLSFQAAFLNDNFRQPRIYLSGTVTDTTLSATAEPNEPAHGGQPAAHSVWWTWLSPSARTVSLTVDATGERLPRLSIYTGNALTNLMLIAENSAYGEIGPTVTFNAEAGRRYLFAIDESTSSYLYSLLLRNAIAPTNDHFAAAQPLPAVFQTFMGSTSAATLEANEPKHLPASLDASVWYIWTNYLEREVTILAGGSRTGSPGEMRASLPEPGVAVYERASLSSLRQVAAGIGSVTLTAGRNAEYYIVIASLTTQAQDFTAMLLTPPRNDRFESAIALSDSGSSSGTVSPTQLRSATRQPGEPHHAGRATGHSLWWTWTARRSGLYVWNNSGSSTSPSTPLPAVVTAIYTGPELSALSLVASNDWSSVAFNAEAGTRYHFALDLKDARVSIPSSALFFRDAFRVTLSRSPALHAPRLRYDDVEFLIAGSLAQAVSVEASFDLVHWEPVRKVILPSSDYRYLEPMSLLTGRKFFRVLSLPNGGAGFSE